MKSNKKRKARLNRAQFTAVVAELGGVGGTARAVGTSPAAITNVLYYNAISAELAAALARATGRSLADLRPDLDTSPGASA